MRCRKAFSLVALILTLSFTHQSQATLIESRGYSLDTSTNIITGSGLEWMNWNETIELTISEVYSMPRFEGWRIATHKEMFGLLDNFFGPNLEVDLNSSKRQRVNGTFGTSFGEDFFSLFTGFIDNFCGYPTGPKCIDNPQNRAKVLYGDIADLKSLFIRDEYVWQVNPALEPVNVWGYLESINGPLNTTTRISETGIALVRDIDENNSGDTNTVKVSAPSSISLIFLAALLILNHRKASLVAR